MKKRKFYDHTGRKALLSFGHIKATKQEESFVWIEIENEDTGSFMNVGLIKEDAIELAKKLRVEIKKI